MSCGMNTCGVWAITAFQGLCWVMTDADAGARWRTLSQPEFYFIMAVKCFGVRKPAQREDEPGLASNMFSNSCLVSGILGSKISTRKPDHTFTMNSCNASISSIP